MSRSIIQIVPRRTDAPDGVGDYATKLAEMLAGSHWLETAFLQGTLASNAPLRDDGWPSAAVSARSANNLDQKLEELVRRHQPVAVIVHVSLYGYQKRGVPLWLVAGLRSWRTRAPQMPLIMIFHETWAGHASSPVQSSFWLAPLQKHIVSSLFSMADKAITTTQYYRALLAGAAGSAKLTVQNVFSNMGEPSAISSIAERPRRLVMFAGEGIAQLSQRKAAAFRNLIKSMGVEEIVDIGGRTVSAPPSVAGVPLTAKGRLPAGAVSDILSTCRVGVLPYGNRVVLGKSGVLAAYAAHGVVPVAFDVTHENADALMTGHDYIDGDAGLPASADLQVMQQRVCDWYQGHTLAKQAQRMAKLIDYREQAA